MESFKSEKKWKITKDQILAFIITISPVILQYHAVILTYGLLLLIAVYFMICLKQGKVYVDKDFMKIGIVLFIQHIISMIAFKSYGSTFTNTIITIEIFCVVVVLGRFIENKNILYNSLKKFAIFCTGVLVLQFLLHTFFYVDYKALIIIPQSEENLKVWITNRPASFFTEPQTYATFIILVLMCTLNKKEIGVSMFFLLGIILCGSSSGILVAFASVLFFVLKNKEIKTVYKYVICILTILIAVIMLILPVFSKYIEKIYTIFNDMSEYSNAQIVNSYSFSNYLRLIKSWQTYFELPLKEKIIGIGLNNFIHYLNDTNTVFKWNSIWSNDARMAGYYTSAGGVFIDCGFFVAIYYYWFLYNKYKKANTDISKGIIILILVHSIYTQIFFNSIFLYYFLLYNAFLNKDEENVRRENDKK